MTNEQIYEKLTNVFRDVFDDDEIVIDSQTTANDIEDWDSLTHITLLSCIEDEFNIKFEMRVISKLKNVGEMVLLIHQLLRE